MPEFEQDTELTTRKWWEEEIVDRLRCLVAERRAGPGATSAKVEPGEVNPVVMVGSKGVLMSLEIATPALITNRGGAIQALPIPDGTWHLGYNAGTEFDLIPAADAGRGRLMNQIFTGI